MKRTYSVDIIFSKSCKTADSQVGGYFTKNEEARRSLYRTFKAVPEQYWSVSVTTLQIVTLQSASNTTDDQ